MGDNTRQFLTDALGSPPASSRPLSGGCVANVALITTENNTRAVLKQGDDSLAIEAHMLRQLAERSSLPVPAVIATAPRLLLIEFIDAAGSLTAAAQHDAADHLAALHTITPTPADDAPSPTAFGFPTDTLIGPLHQPNPWTTTWHAFFRDHRLIHAADAALTEGQLPTELHRRIHRLAETIDEHTCPPPAGPPGPTGRLLHGDCWAGNVLTAPNNEHIAAFIDPAIYFGHPEIELAFSTLFGTFSKPFFDRYAERSDAVQDWPGFHNHRKHLYNLYPLLTHVRLFGSTYLPQLHNTLKTLE